MNVHPLPSDAGSFVPHRDSMLLLDKLQKVELDTGQAEVTVRSSNIFYENQTGLNPVAHIELIAQTAAAHNGYVDIKNKRPVRPGFLVGVKEFHITGSAIEGDKLCIEIKRIFELDNATVLEGKVNSADGTKIAAGNLNLWLLNEGLPPAPNVAKPVSVPGEHGKAAIELEQDRGAAGSYIFKHMRIVKTTREKFTSCISFAPEFVGFQGHFPETPILPGVVMLQTAVTATELFLKKRLRLKKVHKAKFMGQVLPNQLLKTECTVDSGSKRHNVRVQLSADDKKVAFVIFDFEDA